MLMTESFEIQEVLRSALLDRYGADALKERFRAFDTICSATQDRQDAVLKMLDQGGLAWTTQRCDRSAEIVYGWAEDRPFASPFVAEPAARSHVTATIDFTGVEGDALCAALRANGRSRRST